MQRVKLVSNDYVDDGNTDSGHCLFCVTCTNVHTCIQMYNLILNTPKVSVSDS